jgi:hypothetical protein
MESFDGPVKSRTKSLMRVISILERSGIEFLNDGDTGVSSSSGIDDAWQYLELPSQGSREPQIAALVFLSATVGLRRGQVTDLHGSFTGGLGQGQASHASRSCCRSSTRHYRCSGRSAWKRQMAISTLPWRAV